MKLSTQLRRRTHPRGQAAALGAAFGTILVGALSRIHGLDLTPLEGAAIATLCGYAASFLPKPRR